MTDPMRSEIDAISARTVRTVDLGPRAMIVSIAVFVLIVGYILPWMNGANGLEVLLGQGDATGKPTMVPRLFAGVAAIIAILGSALALVTRRWWLAWACAFGGWFAAVVGVLAIWTRQSSAGEGASAPGIGLIIAELAVVVIAVNWLRVAWSRS
jgi:hypothetical protein